MKTAFFSFLFLTGLICAAHAQPAGPEKTFLSEAVKSRKMSFQSPTSGPMQAPIEIHFFWASWCTYCDKAYASLVEMAESPQFKNQILIRGYNMDTSVHAEARQKIKEMPRFDHYWISPDLMKSVPEMSRLPAFIIEDKKTGKLGAYTGYSGERFRSMKKQTSKFLGNTHDE